MSSVDATYRADLRELNELNYARFDAKVEQRMAVLEAHLRSDLRDSIASLRAELIKWSFVFFATAALAVIGLR